jgi:carbon starvation protein
MVTRESDARLIGYGSMVMESLVGLMAIIAAATLDPGVYFAMNVGPPCIGTTTAEARGGRWRSGGSCCGPSR